MNGRGNVCLEILVALAFCVSLDATGAEPAKPAPKAVRKHQLSPRVWEAVTAKLPKFAEQPPAVSEPSTIPNASGYSPDGVLHLEKMTVTKEKIPLSAADVMTPKARLEEALKLLPGLALGPFAHLNQGVAGGMAKDEKLAKARAEVAELVRHTTVAGSSSDRRTRGMMRDATAQPNNDWATSRGASR